MVVPLFQLRVHLCALMFVILTNDLDFGNLDLNRDLIMFGSIMMHYPNQQQSEISKEDGRNGFFSC